MLSRDQFLDDVPTSNVWRAWYRVPHRPAEFFVAVSTGQQVVRSIYQQRNRGLRKMLAFWYLSQSCHDDWNSVSAVCVCDWWWFWRTMQKVPCFVPSLEASWVDNTRGLNIVTFTESFFRTAEEPTCVCRPTTEESETVTAFKGHTNISSRIRTQAKFIWLPKNIIIYIIAKNHSSSQHDAAIRDLRFGGWESWSFSYLLTCKCHVFRIALMSQTTLPVMLNCSQCTTSRFK